MGHPTGLLDLIDLVMFHRPADFMRWLTLRHSAFAQRRGPAAHSGRTRYHIARMGGADGRKSGRRSGHVQSGPLIGYLAVIDAVPFTARLLPRI
jgi:hypothetical protein